MVVLEILLVALVFIVMISLLVAAHEWGHYLFARMFGMGVEEFAIGFGKPILTTFRRKQYDLVMQPHERMPAGFEGREGKLDIPSEGPAMEGGAETREVEVLRDSRGTVLRETTDFTIRPWPIGGFVRIKGMLPHEDGSETRVPGGFFSRPAWQRFLVLFAGPLFSVLAGIAILIPLFMTAGKTGPDNSPVIGAIVKDGVADKAGLRPGDRIVILDGQPVERFFDIIRTVRDAPGREMAVVYTRNGVEGQTTVTPAQDDRPSPVLDSSLYPTADRRVQAKIGVAFGTKTVQLGFLDASREALALPAKTVEGLLGVFRRPDTAEDNLGGPGTIVSLTAGAVRGGLVPVITLAALLSISVGIFNLLPIYPLDGGQMTVALAEMLRGGRRLSMRVQNAIATGGMVLVMALIVSVIAIDIKRFLPKPAEPKLEWRSAEDK